MEAVMILNRYEIFLKVAELGNITRTAEALHYTQAGISHAISALEKEAGVTLLVRSSTGVSLTENGRRLLVPVQKLVNEQRSLAQTIHEINHVVAGTLRIGTFTSVSARWLPHMIRSFRQKYPEVEFELLAGDYNEITDSILSGKVDCGFLSSPAHRDFMFTPLYDDPMLVFMSTDHPLAAKEKLTLAEVKKELLIMPIKGSDNDIMAVLDKSPGKINTGYMLNDDFSVMSMAAHGFGITIMPELIVRNFNFDFEVRPLDPPCFRTIGIASLPLNRVSILTKTFISFLSDPANIDLTLL